ncbi:MAG TPA: hypothetical protein VFZ95_02660 [Steroidobacteraceae bacterium]
MVGLALAGCGDSAPEKSGGPAKTAAKGPKKATVGDNMVAAVSAGKSSTVVGVYFTLGNAPTIDSALPIDIAIVPHQDFTSLQARFYTQGDGLTLMSGDLLPPVADAKAETSLEHKLVLMPRKEGVYMVTANLETDDSAGSVSRIFSIPVIVAPAGSNPSAAPATPAATPPDPATH